MHSKLVRNVLVIIDCVSESSERFRFTVSMVEIDCVSTYQKKKNHL